MFVLLKFDPDGLTSCSVIVVVLVVVDIVDGSVTDDLVGNHEPIAGNAVV